MTDTKPQGVAQRVIEKTGFPINMVKLDELNPLPERCRNTLGHDIEGLAPMYPKDSTVSSDSANYRTIPLTHGKTALVDPEDYDWLSKFSWHAVEDRNTWYAIHTKRQGEPFQHRTNRMHRVILNAGHGQSVDHINGNGLDNRKSNLRIATPWENTVNMHQLRRDNTSGYAGVTLRKDCNKWLAKIRVRGRMYHLGNFGCAECAARVYDMAAREAFGPLAYQNFPSDFAARLGLDLEPEDSDD